MKKKSVEILFITGFIVLYLTVLIFLNLVSSGYTVSFLLLIGIAIIIATLFFFINSNHEKGNYTILQFKALSGDLLKVFLLILMCICTLIPPISNPATVILWEQVATLNYVRAIVFIIGLTYLPGSSLYNIFFPKDNLNKLFKVEPFLIKITIFPILSFSFIGIIVLILDQIGLIKESISLILFILILSLFLCDFFVKKIRAQNINFKSKIVEISKKTFIILILAIGIVLFAIGIFLGRKYLIVEDDWVGANPAIYVGNLSLNPLKDRIYYDNYPVFWGYIIFGLSNLSGLPYININVLLALYCYLSVTSIYLFNKAILIDFKVKYAVLSTILILIFCGPISFVFNPYEKFIISEFIYRLEFEFMYKSYSYVLLFIFMSLFIILTKSNKKRNSETQNQKDFITQNGAYIILGSFFLILSVITYFLPLLIGISFIFIYSILSKNKSPNFKLFFISIVFFYIFYIVFDSLMSFSLSLMILGNFLVFFRFNGFFNFLGTIAPPIIIWTLFGGFIIIFIIFQQIILRTISRKKVKKLFSNYNSKKLFIFFIIIFSIYLITDLFAAIFNIIPPYYDLNKTDFIFYYLNLILVKIGIIGIISIYFSYFCYKRQKRLFFILLSWILVSFFLSSLLIYIEIYINFVISSQKLSDLSIFYMIYWFERFWFYSIPPLCIFASIGIIKGIKKIRKYKIFMKIKYSEYFLKFSVSLILIIFSYSGIIITGLGFGIPDFRISDDKVKIVGWTSENIPYNSGVLSYNDFQIDYCIQTMTYCRRYFIESIFNDEYNQTKLVQQINYLKEKNIKYALISQIFISINLNISAFVNDYLIPNFYNYTLYQSGDLTMYYAPFFA